MKTTNESQVSERWRVRVELSDGMFTCCTFHSANEVPIQAVRNSEDVAKWVKQTGGKIDEIYPC